MGTYKVILMMSNVQKLKTKIAKLHAKAAAPDTVHAIFQEIFAKHGAAGNALAFANLGVIKIESALLWVQEARAVKRYGRPYIHGLPQSLRHKIIHVSAPTAKDALWAMEEGLRCNTLAAVIGEFCADPAAIDFTASRRIAVASEKYGVPAFLIRLDGTPNLSGARERWRVSTKPSHPHPWNPKSLGLPTLSAELFRSRSIKPGTWDYFYDQTANRLDLVSGAGDGQVEQDQSKTG